MINFSLGGGKPVIQPNFRGSESSALKNLSDWDIQALIEFAQTENIQIFLQSGGADTVKPLWPEHPDALFYEIKDFLRIKIQ